MEYTDQEKEEKKFAHEIARAIGVRAADVSVAKRGLDLEITLFAPRWAGIKVLEKIERTLDGNYEVMAARSRGDWLSLYAESW